jgi:hypothetical protein
VPKVVTHTELGVGFVSQSINQSTPGIETHEVVQKILDPDAAIASAGARAIVDVGGHRAGVVQRQVVQEIFDTHAAVRSSGAGAVVDVRGATGGRELRSEIAEIDADVLVRVERGVSIERRWSRE